MSDVSDIILTPALVYKAPYGEAVPVDTVGAGTAWGGNWVNIGWTSTPLTMNYATEEKDAMIQQSLGKVKKWKTKEELKFTFSLSEWTLDNMQLGTDGTVSDTAAGVGQPGKEELVNGDAAAGKTEYAWGFEGSYVDEDGDTFPIRVFVWKGTVKMAAEAALDKENETVLALEVDAIEDMSKAAGQRLFKVSKILEEAT